MNGCEEQHQWKLLKSCCINRTQHFIAIFDNFTIYEQASFCTTRIDLLAKIVPLLDSPSVKLTTTLSTSLCCHTHFNRFYGYEPRILAYSALNYSSFDSMARKLYRQVFEHGTISLTRTSFGNIQRQKGGYDIFKGSLLWPLLASSFKRRLFLQLFLRVQFAQDPLI